MTLFAGYPGGRSPHPFPQRVFQGKRKGSETTPQRDKGNRRRPPAGHDGAQGQERLQTLGKILKIALWLVLLILVLGLLTVLAWWMRWPLATGAVILLGLIACAVLLVAVRFFLRWNNKKIFRSSSARSSANRRAPASRCRRRAAWRTPGGRA